MDESPDPGLIYDLYTGAFRPQIVRLALQLDLFAPLAGGPADAAMVAAACGGSPAGVARLLDVLVGAQVLTRQEGRYALTSSAATFLVRGRPAYAGDLILAWTGPAIWEGVGRAVRTGDPAPFEEYHEQDAWLESYSAWRIGNSLEMWQAAGVEPVGAGLVPARDAPRLRRLLDLACGCAIKSFSLAQRDPALHVTCVDTARVLSVARALAERLGLLGRAIFVEADLLTANLGSDRYDICLLGQITHYLTPDQNRDLFRRVQTALKPDGILVLDVPMTGEQPAEWTALVSVLLWANGGGAAYGFETYRGWLEETGFGRVRQVGERWLASEEWGCDAGCSSFP